MASSHPNDGNLQIGNARNATTSNAHPQYSYWANAWRTIRDCVLGEIEIKAQGQTYLPQMAGQSNEEYNEFLERSYFYNMTARTVHGLVGTIFRRDPKIKNFPEKFKSNLKNITKDNQSLLAFSKEATREVIEVGRFGILLDMPEFADVSGRNTPFMAGYVAENIVDWDVEDVDGRYELTKVVLREVSMDRHTDGAVLAMSGHRSRFKIGYRVLKLVLDEETNRLIYQQWIYTPEAGNTGLPADNQTPDEIITPTSLGRPFDRIPFVFFGPFSNSSEVQKPPLLDIACMNVSHYKSAAQLEHGRHYTALPVYHIQVTAESEAGEYVVGPNTVWEYTGDKPPGIAEYNGHGLGFLEKALDQKEHHISSLGGRMLGVRTQATAESDNLVKLRQQNEQSLLLNVSSGISEGFTQLLELWLKWMGEEPDIDMSVELNQDFLIEPLKAREFRAVTMMYEQGILPIDVIFDVMQKAEVISEYMTLEEFKGQLDNTDNFPNNPDVHARRLGYPDAKTQLELNAQEAEQQNEAPTVPETAGPTPKVN